MSLQAIINTAQSIEINRMSLVATSMSRSGRLITAARNWVKPWQFTVEPRPVWTISEGRAILESIMTNDRFTEQQIKLGQSGASWMTAYQGSVATTSDVLNTITMSAASGTQFTITNLAGLTNGQYIFKVGDIIQPTGHRYPYVVTQDVQFVTGNTTKTFTVNRGYLPQSGYTLAGSTITVGAGVIWRVKVAKLPTYKYLPGQFIQFTDNFEIMESVL